MIDRTYSKKDKNRLIIIGASGHGKVVADIAILNGYREIVFLDNDLAISECAGFRVIGPDSMAADLDGDLFAAVGNGDIRKHLMDVNGNRYFPILVHPDAVIAKGTAIGEGTVIMAGTVINPGVRIGKGCIINTSSSVDHDCEIGDFVHISVGSRLSGTVKVGNETWIGVGATVSNNVNICGGCMIGAGAVVIKDIEEKGTYVGVPAKKKTEIERGGSLNSKYALLAVRSERSAA